MWDGNLLPTKISLHQYSEERAIEYFFFLAKILNCKFFFNKKLTAYWIHRRKMLWRRCTHWAIYAQFCPKGSLKLKLAISDLQSSNLLLAPFGRDCKLKGSQQIIRIDTTRRNAHHTQTIATSYLEHRETSGSERSLDLPGKTTTWHWESAGHKDPLSLWECKRYRRPTSQVRVGRTALNWPHLSQESSLYTLIWISKYRLGEETHLPSYGVFTLSLSIVSMW